MGPSSRRRRLAPRIIGIIVGLVVASIVLVVGFYIDLLANFCIDFSSDNGDQCAEENRNFALIMFLVVIPLSAAAGIASGIGLTRMLRRRERRRAS